MGDSALQQKTVMGFSRPKRIIQRCNQFRKLFLIPFIGINVVVIYLLLPSFSYKIHIPAVNMNLTNYEVSQYVKKKLIKIDGGIGSANYVFKGPSALYDVYIAYVDEDDGNCSFNFVVNHKTISTWVADQNPVKDRLFTKKIENVHLKHSDWVEIQGIRNEGENARIESIEFITVDGLTISSYLSYIPHHLRNVISNSNPLISTLLMILYLIINMILFKLSRGFQIVKFPQTPELVSYSETFLFQIDESIEPTDAEDLSIPEDTIPDPESSDTTTLAEASDTGMKLDNFTEKMISYIDENYTDSNFSVQGMADHFEISPSYLSKYFKDYTGQNIIFYITDLRMNKAKDLLLTTELPLKTVAEQSGYYNVSSFIRRFKQITGMTPGEYRAVQEDAI